MFSFGQTNVKIKSEKFVVHGNCGMCKTRIDSAAKNTYGVMVASWDINSKIINVVFNTQKTNLDSIHLSISKMGYRTDEIIADSTGYQNLPGCCQVKNAFVNPKNDNK
tara:strand:+ start:578 stop:901 length:324 start_codon:yes stop_codon:yes gene_type:complete